MENVVFSRDLDEKQSKSLNLAKKLECDVINFICELADSGLASWRWSVIAKQDIEKSFMCIERAIKCPEE